MARRSMGLSGGCSVGTLAQRVVGSSVGQSAAQRTRQATGQPSGPRTIGSTRHPPCAPAGQRHGQPGYRPTSCPACVISNHTSCRHVNMLTCRLVDTLACLLAGWHAGRRDGSPDGWLVAPSVRPPDRSADGPPRHVATHSAEQRSLTPARRAPAWPTSTPHRVHGTVSSVERRTGSRQPGAEASPSRTLPDGSLAYRRQQLPTGVVAHNSRRPAAAVCSTLGPCPSPQHYV